MSKQGPWPRFRKDMFASSIVLDHQALGNLLSNALKFTPAGGKVIVRFGPKDGGTAVAVADTGAGIDAADVPRLFQPFSRIGTQTQGKHTGTGLGLFIAKGIVEGHGGRIWVESPGKGLGATFHLWLPSPQPS